MIEFLKNLFKDPVNLMIIGLTIPLLFTIIVALRQLAIDYQKLEAGGDESFAITKQHQLANGVFVTITWDPWNPEKIEVENLTNTTVNIFFINQYDYYAVLPTTVAVSPGKSDSVVVPDLPDHFKINYSLPGHVPNPATAIGIVRPDETF